MKRNMVEWFKMYMDDLEGEIEDEVNVMLGMVNDDLRGKIEKMDNNEWMDVIRMVLNDFVVYVDNGEEIMKMYEK